MRLIDRFNEIGKGKMLAVDKSRNEFNQSLSTLSKEPGSLNFNVRREQIEKIDQKNVQLLERLARPSISDYLKHDTHLKFWN